MRQVIQSVRLEGWAGLTGFEPPESPGETVASCSRFPYDKPHLMTIMFS